MLRVFCPCDMTTVESLSGGRLFFFADDSMESSERHSDLTSIFGFQSLYKMLRQICRGRRRSSQHASIVTRHALQASVQSRAGLTAARARVRICSVPTLPSEYMCSCTGAGRMNVTSGGCAG